jgi:hypothetical protein
MPAQERTDLFNFAHKHNPMTSATRARWYLMKSMHMTSCASRSCSHEQAHCFQVLPQGAGAAALDWLEDQFTGRAADQWHIVVREALRIIYPHK